MLTLLVLFFLVGHESRRTFADPGAPNIDITWEAVQTFYQGGVPHTDALGNIRTSYDPTQSFFPNGIYFLTPCMVSEPFHWDEFMGEPPEGWDGRYRLTVNLGSVLNLLDDSQTVFDEVVTQTSATASWLPADTSLYYSVRLEGTDRRIAEGAFTSAPCPDPEGANPIAATEAAGFNFAIILRPADTLVLSQEVTNSGFRLVSDMRSGGNSLFPVLKDDPLIYGWYMDDEPLLRSRTFGIDPATTYESLASTYDELSGQTKQVLFFTESPFFVGDPWGPQFIRLGDVGVHCNYPKSAPNELQTVRGLASTLRYQTTVLQGVKPSWLVVQSFGAESAGTWEFPTPQEARAMIYAALIHGATGIIHFAWDSHILRGVGLMGIGPGTSEGGVDGLGTSPLERTPESVALWNTLASSENGVNREITELTPIILSSTSKEPYHVFVNQRPNSSAPIRTMLKEYKGSYYLLAVNIDNATIDAKFQFNVTLEHVQALFEGSLSYYHSGTSIIDSFPPFAVHVYKIDRACSNITGTRQIPAIDVNGDGDTDSGDRYIILTIAKRVVDARSYSPAFDLNKDGCVDSGDCLLLARLLAKKLAEDAPNSPCP